MHINRSRRLKFLPTFFIILGFGFICVWAIPFFRAEVWYFLKQKRGQQIILSANKEEASPFGKYLLSKPIFIQPVDKEFGIVIEKIGVNAPIVADVVVWDEAAYKKALKNGVAHASTSPYPSKEAGNVYLFAHSSAYFWDYGRYAQVFNLLRKLEFGDKIHIFYKGEVYIYKVVNKEIYKGFNTYPLTRSVIEPILTLQTCDPPGTTINRLVVTAKLAEVKGINEFL